MQIWMQIYIFHLGKKTKQKKTMYYRNPSSWKIYLWCMLQKMKCVWEKTKKKTTTMLSSAISKSIYIYVFTYIYIHFICFLERALIPLWLHRRDSYNFVEKNAINFMLVPCLLFLCQILSHHFQREETDGCFEHQPLCCEEFVNGHHEGKCYRALFLFFSSKYLNLSNQQH